MGWVCRCCVVNMYLRVCCLVCFVCVVNVLCVCVPKHNTLLFSMCVCTHVVHLYNVLCVDVLCVCMCACCVHVGVCCVHVCM